MKIIAVVFLFLVLSVSGFAQTVSGTIVFKATATDNTAAANDTECGISSVQIFNGAVAISPLLTVPTSGNDYTFSWDTKGVINGNYVITAVAKDKAGPGTTPANLCDGSKPNATTSNALNIVIDNRPADTTGPSITITLTITVTP